MLKLLQSAFVDAHQGRFIAHQELEGGAGLGQLAEDVGEAAVVVDFAELFVNIVLRERELVIEQAGFESADAAQTPAGDGHGMDQLHFRLVGGLVAGDEGVEEVVEIVFVLVRQDGESCGESMAQGVAGRFGFAFGGDGSARLGAVDACGIRFVGHLIFK